ncbi:MAG: hypothetical protein HYX92_10740 [Chloroflexi bacterium]|nr:hypothetical protein [Chloroflexota bacterium]
MTRRKQRLLTREEVSINREADYIVKKAQAYDGRVVGLGGLVFFSTHTGDAWILDPADSLALCLAQDGERQNFSILEIPTRFQIAWESRYLIEGETFVVTTTDGHARTILGYPTREIQNTISRGEKANPKACYTEETRLRILCGSV